MIRIKRILCPVDFSECSRRALDHAAALAAWYGASVSVLYVHRVTTPVLATGPFAGIEALQPFSLNDDDRSRLMQALDGFVAEDRKAGVHIDTILDERLTVVAAIVAWARSTSADLITIGTHGRSGFERFMLGSITEKVLRRAPCPVLTVPPHAPEAVRTPVSFERVLCPVDFSDGSARALEYAAAIAGDAKAELCVLHVIELPPDVADVNGAELATYRRARYDEAHAAMADALAPIRQVCPPKELLLAGRAAAPEILRVAAEQLTDLIVIGVHGRNVVDRMLFGSVTQQVVRQATCPVLTLPGRD
jgi:nucleotide-binding universal stress UspA family protein